MKKALIGIPLMLAFLAAIVVWRRAPAAANVKKPELKQESARPVEPVPAPTTSPARPEEPSKGDLESAINGVRVEIGAGGNLLRAIKRQVDVLQQSRETKPETVRERIDGLLAQIANQRPAAASERLVVEVDRFLAEPASTQAAAESFAQSLLAARQKAEELATEAERHLGAIELLRRREGIEPAPLVDFANAVAAYRDALRQACGVIAGEVIRLQSARKPE
jgi:hypothetical protein